jgi:methyl-accepting chemotaxis protein
MKFRRHAPAVLIATATLVIATVTLVSNKIFSGMSAAVERDQLVLMRSIAETSLHNAETKALARASLIAELPRTKELFAARDRDALLAEYAPMFHDQSEKYGVDQAHFHVPPAVSFLRIHLPEKFGDDLSSFRPMVVAVNRELTPRKGFAIARSGPAMFGVVPMFDRDRKHIGSFEIGVSFAEVLDGIKQSYGMDAVIFVKEEPLKKNATAIPKAVFSDENRVGAFLRYYATNAALFERLVVDRDLDAIGGEQVREALGANYGMVAVPLRNGSGDALGMIVVAKDFSHGRAAEKRAFVWQILAAVFGTVILAGAVLVVIRGLLVRPLDELTRRFATLGESSAAPDAKDDEPLCEELEALAVQYGRLERELEGREKP